MKVQSKHNITNTLYNTGSKFSMGATPMPEWLWYPCPARNHDGTVGSKRMSTHLWALYLTQKRPWHLKDGHVLITIKTLLGLNVPRTICLKHGLPYFAQIDFAGDLHATDCCNTNLTRNTCNTSSDCCCDSSVTWMGNLFHIFGQVLIIFCWGQSPLEQLPP